MPDETKDTQPLIKDILEEMRDGFAMLREQMQTFRVETIERLIHIEKRLDRFERKFDVLTADIIDLRARVSDLERKPNQI